MFAESRERDVPRIRRAISGQQNMVTIFFTSTRLLALEPWSKGTKLNQDYFIQAVLPGLSDEKRRISRGTGLSAFSVHVDNSMCHNGHKVWGKFDQGSIERAPHPPYSPDVSVCNFWLFGMLKHEIKDRECQSQEEIVRAIAESWDDLTFAEVQSVFWEWMERRTWVAGNNGKYHPNEKTSI
jgi:hypothetical protein